MAGADGQKEAIVLIKPTDMRTARASLALGRRAAALVAGRVAREAQG